MSSLATPTPIGQARRPAFGAECRGDATEFRYWAPAVSSLSVAVADGPEHRLHAVGEGWLAGRVAGLGHGALYRLRLDGELLPDPFSRYQPQGPLGPSMIVDARRYRWRCAAWPAPERPVIYEMHIGTFTAEGTWRAAIDRLPLLAEIGITLLEVMPLADFAGGFGWGYDGACLFAPTRLYGEPDDFRAFVDAAHVLGMGVVLDVVYNHLGPIGGFLERLAPSTTPSATSTTGGRPSTTRAPAAARSASWPPPTPPIGSRTSVSTACASTPRRTSMTSTRATSISWP